MDKRTAERKHRQAMKTGKVVQWYPAKPKPRVPVEEEVFSPCPAQAILKSVLDDSSELKDVLILMRDKNDQCGLISNLENPADNLLFLKQCETQLISTKKAGADTPPPRTTA